MHIYRYENSIVSSHNDGNASVFDVAPLYFRHGIFGRYTTENCLGFQEIHTRQAPMRGVLPVLVALFVQDSRLAMTQQLHHVH